MSKLNQIIAVANGKKSMAKSTITNAHQLSQKPELFTGLERNYEPIEDGAVLPPESKKVQFTVDDVISSIRPSITDMMDVVLTQDAANQEAKSDIVVNDVTVASDVPVSTLIFLEKQLIDLNKFVSTLPELDNSEDWTKDPNSGYFRSNETKTHRLEKIPTPVVLYEATPEHPAQVQLSNVDKLAGYWSTVKLSGAMPRTEKQQTLQRITDLKESIVKARESANSIGVDQKKIGEDVLNYIFS